MPYKAEELCILRSKEVTAEPLTRCLPATTGKIISKETLRSEIIRYSHHDVDPPSVLRSLREKVCIAESFKLTENLLEKRGYAARA